MVSPSSSTRTPADRLWQFQLRKENKAILEQSKEAERKNAVALAVFEDKTNVLEQRLEALEAKLAESERQRLEKEQEHSKTRRQLKAQVTEVKERLRALLQERDLTNASKNHQAITEGRVPRSGQETTQGPPVPSKEYTTTPKDPSSRRPRQLLMPSPSNEEFTPTTEGSRPPTRSTKTKHKDVLPTQAVNRSNRCNTVERTIEPLAAAGPPSLAQSTSTMQVYYDACAEIYKSHVVSDESRETQFVNSFIKGISAASNKETLLAHLQQMHPSKSKRGGVEVLCSWIDVFEGLSKTGLLGEKALEVDGVREKRNQDPRGGIEMTLPTYRH